MAYHLLKAYSNANMSSILGVPGGDSEKWARDVALITAKVAVDTVNEVSKTYPKGLVQKAVITRILQGVLWTILDGGAPGKISWNEWSKTEDRSLECSLSSRWLKSRDIVYIS